MKELTHFDNYGNAHMVDVSEKDITERIAIATGKIKLSPDAFLRIKNKTAGKGDVLTVSQLAGIMGAKKTSDLIPLCHNINLTGVSLKFELLSETFEVKVISKVKTNSVTGVEMEALTSVSIALLTIYDMVKAIDKDMEIGDIYLLEKSGGRSGHYVR